MLYLSNHELEQFSLFDLYKYYYGMIYLYYFLNTDLKLLWKLYFDYIIIYKSYIHKVDNRSEFEDQVDVFCKQLEKAKQDWEYKVSINIGHISGSALDIDLRCIFNNYKDIIHNLAQYGCEKNEIPREILLEKLISLKYRVIRTQNQIVRTIIKIDMFENMAIDYINNVKKENNNYVKIFADFNMNINNNLKHEMDFLFLDECINNF